MPDEHRTTTTRPRVTDAHTGESAVYDPSAHTPAGASLDWGPCCVCGATDAQPCPTCPGETEKHLHSLAFKANAGSDPGAMDGTLVRSAHEENHRGCDVCINCINLAHDGQPFRRR